MNARSEAMSHRDANDEAWQRRYSDAPVVGAYREANRLQAPELAIFGQIGPALAQSSLLDIGVGAGRTAAHLAGAAMDYVGIDYAAAMVQACHERFAAAPWYSPARFREADVRALPFENEHFEIVLFSFNGLDHVLPPQRALALAECHRVLKPGGWFIHSGHNLSWFDGSGLLPRSRGWRDWLGQYRYLKAMKQINAGHGRSRSVDETALRDPPHGLLLHYARPSAHLRELRSAGLVDARVFDRRGREITRSSRLNANRDTWLYYLSRRPTAAVPVGGRIAGA